MQFFFINLTEMVLDQILIDAITAASKATFNLDTPAIKFEDLADYQALGVDIVGGDTVKGILKITSPAPVVLYTNANWSAGYGAPDIDINAADRDLSGVAFVTSVQGNYKFEYNVQVVYDPGGPAEETQILNITILKNFCTTLPTVAITHQVDCQCGVLISTDSTVLPVNGTIPVVDSRVHTVVHPSGLIPALPDTVSGGLTITISPIYGGTVANPATYTTRVVLILTYTFTGGIVVTGTIKGTKERPVTCPSNLCDLYCCVVQTYRRWRNMLLRNDSKAAILQKIYYSTMANVQLYQLGGRCGMSLDQNQLYEDILNMAECSAGCGCEEGTPQLIVPTCGSAITAVVDAGAGIVVSVNTAGGITTYTVAIDPVVLAQIAAANVTVLTTNTPTLIGITQLAAGSYRVDWLGGTINILDFYVQLIMTSATTYTIALSEENNIGDRYQTATFEAYPAAVIAGAGIGARFVLKTFLLLPAADVKIDKIFVELVQSTAFAPFKYYLEQQLVTHDNSIMAFNDGLGAPITYQSLFNDQATNKFHIQIIGG